MNDAYVAGLFDGEGSVGIYQVKKDKTNKYYWGVCIQIVGTHKPMIEAVYNYFKIGNFTTQKRQSKQRTPLYDYGEGARYCKQGWKWRITSKNDTKIFIERIMPFLFEKKEQCRVVLDWINGEIEGSKASELCKEYKRFSFKKDDVVYRYTKHSFKGEKNPISKLSNEDAENIRNYVNNGGKQIEMVKKYSVSKTIVSRIIKKKTYA